MKNPKIIILNGRKYDALTGKPLVRGVPDIMAQIPVKTEKLIQKIQTQKPHFINDFTASSNKLIKPIQDKKPIANKLKPIHNKAADTKRQLLKSNTLMRKPLVKPDLSSKSSIQTIRKTNYISRGNTLLNQTINPGIIKDSIIFRTKTIKDKTSDLINNISAEPPITSTSIHERNIKKIESTSDDNLYKSAAAQVDEQKAQTSSRTKNQVKTIGFKLKALYISSGIALLLVILTVCGIYFKYDLELSYANIRIGINGTFPKYLPLGYKLSKFSYHKSGQIESIDFAYHPAHSDLNNYLYIYEANSALDNTGLLANDITPVAGNNYQTILVNGISVYYFSHQYIWVNAGMIYTITDQTGLNQEVITKIIRSI